MVADGEGIGYQGQAKIAWGGIKRVDSSMLQSKGVLDLYDASGRKLRLDAWYLTNFRDLVAFVEKRVPAESLDSH
jgi:hypothetical protein